MNFYDGELIRKADGTYAVKVGDAVIDLSEEKNAHLKAHDVQGQDVTVGVRPEHITLDHSEGKMVKGTIDVAELMGASEHLHINAMGKDGIIIVPTLNLKASNFQIGDPIEFTFPGSMVHVFDKRTGLNLEDGPASN